MCLDLNPNQTVKETTIYMRTATKLKLRIKELEREISLLKAINEQGYDMAHSDSIHQHRDNQRNRRLRA